MYTHICIYTYEYIYTYILYYTHIYCINIIWLQRIYITCQQIWKTQQWPQDWKRSVFLPIPKKGNPKECSNYRTIVLISHASKVMLKFLQARLQKYMN